jgi:hypothetical protein
MALSPGQVLRLYFNTLYGEPKEKYCIVACVEPKIRFLLISSEIGAFKHARPALRRQQVKMLAAEHAFLHHDSYVDCAEPLGYALREADLTRLIEREPERVCGTISVALRARILEAVGESETLPMRQIEWIVAGLSERR